MKLFKIILEPINLLIIFILVLIFFIFKNQIILIKKLSIFLIFYLLLIGYLPISYFIISKLENYYTHINIDPKNLDAIVIMGGSFNTGKWAKERDDISLNFASERLFKAIELYKKNPEIKIIYSGFSSSIKPEGWNESDMAKFFFTRQGLKINNFIFENKSRNTFENAKNTSIIIKKKNFNKIGLITSAIHMPRAMLSFNKKSIFPYSIPTDFMTGKSFISLLSFNLIIGFDNWSKIIHEIFGIIYYKISGKI